MHRFFVPPEAIEGDRAVLTADQARQLAKVLRARPGDTVAVLDGSGQECLVRLDRVTPREAWGRILGRRPCPGEPSLRLALYQALLKGDRFEWVLQKGTELGSAAFVPVLFARSLPRPDADAWARGRYQRWERIIREAAEQSGRGRLPALLPPRGLAEACDGARGLRLALWEGEGSRSLWSALEEVRREKAPPREVSLLVGPEGGFTPQEVALARAAGFVTVSLGPRTLRAETAGVVAVALVMYHLGQMAPADTSGPG